LNFKKFALLAAQAADDKKAGHIMIMDLKKLTPMADYFVICQGESTPQVRAIAEAVEQAMEEHGLRHIHKEGISNSRWILLDYGGIIVHIFHKEAHSFYHLERIWGEAKEVKWEAKPAPAKAKTRLKKLNRD
jgi:ribosome-associated protein